MTLQSNTDGVREIEAAAAPSRFARGWHCLGLTKEFGDGKPHAVHAFGRKLVVFRSGDGTINALDGYCRHMGGDLTEGEVKGDEIACPFHDWRWGGDGRCKRVPYSKRTPRLARTAKWTTLEQDGMLFVWNDPQGNPPPPEVTIPRIEGASSDEWTDWHWYTTVVHTNCREIVDNVVDMAHFFYIHGSLPTHFKNIFEGHVATQYMNSAGRPDLGGTEGAWMLGTTSVASYYGPSGAVLVFPGGDYDAYRPSWQQNIVNFRGRMGYVRTAIESGVPIVPIVSIGGQEGQLYLNRGMWLAKKLGIKERMRTDILPISLGLPFGLTLIPLNLPLPTKVVTQVLEPLHIEATFGDDPDVEAVDAHVRSVMREALNDLAAQRRFPVLG